MKKGEVAYCPRYQFANGTVSDKLLINLNNPLDQDPYLVLLTTSKQKFRKNNPGCHSAQGYYLISKDVDFFNEDTWVLFHTLREFTLKDELKESWSNNLKIMQPLKDTTLRAIINCLKQSNYITKYQMLLLK